MSSEKNVADGSVIMGKNSTLRPSPLRDYRLGFTSILPVNMRSSFRPTPLYMHRCAPFRGASFQFPDNIPLREFTSVDFHTGKARPLPPVGRILFYLDQFASTRKRMKYCGPAVPVSMELVTASNSPDAGPTDTVKPVLIQPAVLIRSSLVSTM